MNYYSEVLRCIICNTLGVDLHHWKSRGSGGEDENYNLIPLCHLHHQECHNIGAMTFSKKYSKVWNWLHKNGWREVTQGGKIKWVHLEE